MANERITENIVRKHFLQFESDCFIEEQKSANPKIDKLLNNASKKVYHYAFRQRTARYIIYELRLKHVPQGQRIEFPIIAVYKRTDGTIFHRSTKNSYVEHDWANSVHRMGCGWEDPGKWPIDIYTVQIYIKGHEIVSESFRILWD